MIGVVIGYVGVIKADKGKGGSVHRKGEMGEFHLRTFTVTITRRNTSSSWGISIAGGCDQGTPLVITKVRTKAWMLTLKYYV